MLGVTIVSGKVLMVQDKSEVRFEEFHSWYSMGKRVEQLHKNGAITQQKYNHLSGAIDRHMKESVNVRR